MDFQIDAHTSAYGLFHVAFAGLDTRLSQSVAALLCCRKIETTFTVVRRIPFGRRLEILHKAIKTWTGNSDSIPEMDELRHACDLAKDVSKWRNDRIHSEVRFDENRPVIVDEEGKPVQIDYQTCVQKIREAIHAGTTMQAAVRHLVAWEMDLHDLMDESS